MASSTATGRWWKRCERQKGNGLRLRDRRDRGHVGGHGLAVARGRLEAQLDRVLQRRYRLAENQRLAHHLLRERDAVFPFLYCPGLEATNWRAEQAIRPMVVTRKVWGGNRTPRGAHTQGVLLLLETCRQQHRPIQPVLQQLLCSPHPIALNFTAPHRSPPQRSVPIGKLLLAPPTNIKNSGRCPLNNYLEGKECK